MVLILLRYLFYMISRFKVLVTDWKEFVLLIKNIQVEDGGPYQCQVYLLLIKNIQDGGSNQCQVYLY